MFLGSGVEFLRNDGTFRRLGSADDDVSLQQHGCACYDDAIQIDCAQQTARRPKTNRSQRFVVNERGESIIESAVAFHCQAGLERQELAVIVLAKEPTNDATLSEQRDINDRLRA